jgi:hypothetical protein
MPGCTATRKVENIASFHGHCLEKREEVEKAGDASPRPVALQISKTAIGNSPP